jgi:Holliday junction resolvase RusA-like endonuclease
MLSDMVLHIPYPKYKNQLVSANVWNRVHWVVRKKIKQNLKALIKDWYLEQQVATKWKAIEIEATLHRKGNRKFDAINIAVPTLKIIEDCFTELGYIKDDDKNRIIINPTVLGGDDNILEIKIKELK